jgi:uncharacterized protein with PIN domain
MKQKKFNNYKESDKRCRECGQCMIEISHKEIKEKQLKQPYYYSKWYKCENCRKLFNFEKDIVWNKNNHAEAIQFLEETSQLFKNLK